MGDAFSFALRCVSRVCSKLAACPHRATVDLFTRCVSESTLLVLPQRYSLPLLAAGLGRVVELVGLVRKDDITIVHPRPPPPDQRGCGV